MWTGITCKLRFSQWSCWRFKSSKCDAVWLSSFWHSESILLHLQGQACKEYLHGKTDVLHTNKTSMLSPVPDSYSFLLTLPNGISVHLQVALVDTSQWQQSIGHSIFHLIKPITIQLQPFSGPHCSLFNRLYNLLLFIFHLFYYYTNTPNCAWSAFQYHHWPPVVLVVNKRW